MYQKITIDLLLFFNVADADISYEYRKPYVIDDGDGDDGDDNDAIIVIRRALTCILYLYMNISMIY